MTVTLHELVELEPGNDANFLGLAGVALRLRESGAAQRALADVSAAGRLTAPYLRVAAGLALSTGNQPALAKSLAALAQLEPDNLRTQFNAAAVQVFSRDPSQLVAARAKLEELARHGPLRIRATLQLLKLVPPSAGQTAYATLASRLLPDSLNAGQPGFSELAQHMEAAPQPEPIDASELVYWLAAHGRAAEALRWIARLDADTRASDPVLVACALCAALVRDWPALSSALQAGAWGPTTKGVVELAFGARAQHDQVSFERALETWDDAVTLSAKSLESLRMLEKLASLWTWPAARENVLWQTARSFPHEQTVWRMLAIAAESAGDSGKLATVFTAWAAAWPDDRYVRSSREFLGVLREDTDPVLVREAIAALGRPDALPEEVAAAAWALSREGRAPEGLAALDKVAEQTAQRPRAALIYGVLLADAGRVAESKRFLALAPSERLLPEERALLTRAKAKLDLAP